MNMYLFIVLLLLLGIHLDWAFVPGPITSNPYRCHSAARFSYHFPLLASPMEGTRTKATTHSNQDNKNGATHDNDDKQGKGRALEQKLLTIAQKLRLEVFDLDEGIYGYDTKDSRCGLEVVHTSLPVVKDGKLGLELMEMASAGDGRGLVLVSGMSGMASKAKPSFQVGDVLTGVSLVDQKRGTVLFRERLTGLDYDNTVGVIGLAKQQALKAKNSNLALSFEINRVVERAAVTVELVEADGRVRTLEALAGENLRRLLQRKGIQIYNRKTKRFDMPYATGDCAGEGMCGTCLVAIEQGKEFLSPKDSVETMITKGRPLSWRASCRTVVGFDNQPGTIRIRTQPQNNLQDEIDPGVRHLDSE